MEHGADSHEDDDLPEWARVERDAALDAFEALVEFRADAEDVDEDDG